MAERSNASSRSGTPLLWGGGAAPSGLTFNAADVPNLLMPFTATVQQPSAPDEVDHFMGQEPPPAAAAANLFGGASARDSPSLLPAQIAAKVRTSPAPPPAASASFFDQLHASDFVVGFGSAPPPAAGAAAQPLQQQPFAQSQAAARAAAASFSPVEPPRRPEQSNYATPIASLAAAATPSMGAAGGRSNPAAAADTSMGGSPGLFPGLSSLYRSPAAATAPPSSAMTVFDHGQADQLAAAAPPTSYQAQPGLQPPSALRSSSSLPSMSPNIAAALAPLSHQYRPVQHHWFYRKVVEGKMVWTPFSRVDSANLEKASVHCQVAGVNLTVPTDGGRYDVDIAARRRMAAYWSDEEPTMVKRCSWFYKDELDHRFVPYDEDFAARLEDEYKNAIYYNVWHKRLEFPGEETIVMHNPNVVVHFRPSSQPDEWGTSQQGDQARPLVVKRGAEEVDAISPGEPPGVDHLVFVVQGIGPVCDLRFRTLVECVDDIRATAQKMVETHYRSQGERGRVFGRVEFLPVRWHEALRSGGSSGTSSSSMDDSVNIRLNAITPDGVRKLRQFSNETLLDILFYTSPFYSQKIVDQVAGEMNRMYEIFQRRNPTFHGAVSVAGHSLGALILFDLLSHQGTAAQGDAVAAHPVPQPTASGPAEASATAAAGTASEMAGTETIESLLKKLGLSEFVPKFHQEKIDIDSLVLFEDDDWKELSLPLGPRKKLKAFLQEEKKHGADAGKRVQPIAAPAPAATYPASSSTVTASGLVPTTGGSNGSSNGRHTSVSYEPGSDGGVGRPACKYPQLNFSPASFFALGSPIAMFLTVRGVDGLGSSYHLPTCPRFFNIFHPYDPVAYRMEPLVLHSDVPVAKPVLVPHHKGRKRMHLELKESLSRVGSDLKHKFLQSLRSTWNTIHDFALAHRTGAEQRPAVPSSLAHAPASDQHSEQDELDSELVEAMAHLSKDADDAGAVDADGPSVGLLNGGRRLDYVLQEGPLESFNEYLFSLASHVCYWESEDTALMIVREVYATMNVQADERVPGTPLGNEPPFRSGSPHNRSAAPLLPPPPAAAAAPPLLAAVGGSLPPFSVGHARQGALARGPPMPTASPAANSPLPATGAPVSAQPFFESAGPPPLSGFVARH